MNEALPGDSCEQHGRDGERPPAGSRPATGATCAHGSAGASPVAFVRRARNGATFVFRRGLPEGMTHEEALRRCEEAIRALAEGNGR